MRQNAALRDFDGEVQMEANAVPSQETCVGLFGFGWFWGVFTAWTLYAMWVGKGLHWSAT